jgi:hypothetical protein
MVEVGIVHNLDNDTYTLSGLTEEHLRTVLYAVAAHRDRYLENANDPEYLGDNKNEEYAFLLGEAARCAQLIFDVFLNQDSSTRTYMTNALSTDLDI